MRLNNTHARGSLTILMVALFALLAGCDAQPPDSSAIAEKPQPPQPPIYALRAQAAPHTEPLQRDQLAEGIYGKAASQQVPSQRREPSQSGNPNRAR